MRSVISREKVFRDGRRCLQAGLLAASVFLVSCSVAINKDNVKSSVLAKEIAAAGGEGPVWAAKGETSVFSLEGKANLLTMFTWPQIDKAGGAHIVEHKWYTNDTMVSSSKELAAFGKPPVQVMGSIPTAKLGPGKHRVELCVGGEFVLAKEFEIKEK